MLFNPVIINGELWRVITVSSDSPALIDWTGQRRLATTDYESKAIRLSTNIQPPLLDQVLLHEVAHAVIRPLGLPRVEDERVAQIVERHAIEATVIASEALGRPLCIRGFCS